MLKSFRSSAPRRWRFSTAAASAAPCSKRSSTARGAAENLRRDIRRSRWPRSGWSDEQRSERIVHAW